MASDTGSRREALRGVDAAITDEAGGYLENVVRRAGVTCTVCSGALDATTSLCRQCTDHRTRWGDRLADRVGAVTYAISDRQAGRMMHAYKGRPPITEHHRRVGQLLTVALQAHVDCLRVVAGAPVSHWCTVPSAHRDLGRGEHPLHGIVVGLVRSGTRGEVTLTATITAADPPPRWVGDDRFTVDRTLSAGDHVLVVDDVWTTGSNVQSAALALRAAGAEHVSSLVVARWLKPDYPPTQRLMEDVLGNRYHAEVYPWTGGTCPSGSTGVSA